MNQQAEQQTGEKNDGSRTALRLERGVAVVGALLVTASLGFLLYEGWFGDHTPPDLRVTVDAISRNSDGYLVRFTAANSGGETAAAVRVVGTLLPVQGQPQQAEVTLDYVPGASTVTGGLFFTDDPTAGTLELRATGYQNP